MMMVNPCWMQTSYTCQRHPNGSTTRIATLGNSFVPVFAETRRLRFHLMISSRKNWRNRRKCCGQAWLFSVPDRDSHWMKMKSGFLGVEQKLVLLRPEM